MAGEGMSLPKCAVQHPACGACGDDTEHDGDSFYCDGCDLDYGNGDDGNEAQFRDEELPECGKPCDNGWHDAEHLDLECTPCKLPAGHRNWHWTDCQFKTPETPGLTAHQEGTQ